MEQGALFINSLLEYFGWENANVSDYTVQREKPDNVDVAAFKKGAFAIFIENKVTYHERPKQMTKLIKALISYGIRDGIPIEKRFAVFLTDDGRESSTAPTIMPEGLSVSNLHAIDRLRLFSLFLTALQRKSTTQKSPLLVAFLENYAHTIGTHPGAKP